MKEWLDKILSKRKRKIEMGKKGLLIMDNMAAHVGESIKVKA
jgi:hypothetical protein